MKLTREQERVLLHKHLTGEFPGQKWATIQALADKGMIELGHDATVTPQGKAYCDAHHLHIRT